MTQWILGYPNSLDAAASYTAGKALYNSYGVDAITLDSQLMNRGVAKVSGTPTYSGVTLRTTVPTNTIHVYPSANNAAYPGNTAFTANEFDNGYFRMLSGTAEEEVYKVAVTNAGSLEISGNITPDGIDTNDYLDVVGGSCSFTFPSGRNPIKWDVKRVYSSKSMRFPYYTGGISVPIGWKEDSIILMSHLTTQKDVDRLETFLTHKIDYEGFCAFSSGEEAAPVIFQTSADHNGQYLTIVDDYRITKDASKGDNYWEVMINLNLYHKILYRGI